MPAPQAPFIGRIAEREQLNQEWLQVSQRRLRVVSLAGELGIGKTRLWHEWKDTLPAESTVLETYCLDTNQSHPFGPIIRLLRNDPCASALLGSASPLNSIWLAELNRLLPELRDLNPDLPEPLTMQPAEERSRLFEALTQLIAYFGKEPFVIFIDDLHWTDPVTLDWLVYMVDRLRDLPIFLILAFRPEELPSQVTQTLVGWHRQRISRRIALPPLSLSETTELLSKLGSDLAVAPTLQSRSGGNPYFIVELGRAEPDTIPQSIVDLINARLRSLPKDSRPLLQAASVLKGEFEVVVLKRMTGESHEETLDNLDMLIGAGIFDEHGGEYSFAQPMVEALVYDSLSTARRRFLHAQAATALENIRSGSLEPVAADLAYHFADGGYPTKAAYYADMAAEWALGMSAPEDAAVFYRQAYLWEPTLARMTDLGRALAAAGDLPEAQEALRDALVVFERERDRVGIARAQLALAGSYALSGDREQIVYYASRALKQLKGYLEPEMESQAYIMLGMGEASVNSRLIDAERNLLRASEIAEANNLTQTALQSQFERANLLAQRGELQDAVKLFALTAEQSKANANPVQEMLAYNNLAYHEHLLGDMTAARAHIETALAMSEEYSLSPFSQYLFSTYGEIALAEGELADAERWFEQAMAEAIVANNQPHHANLKASMGKLAQVRGDLDAALLLLQEARLALPADGESFLRIKIELWTAELHIARGERTATAEVLTRVKSILETSEYEGYKRWANAIELQLSTV
jgi:predicted ATPase